MAATNYQQQASEKLDQQHLRAHPGNWRIVDDHRLAQSDLKLEPPTVLRLQLDRPPPGDKPSSGSFSWLSSVLLCHLNMSVLRLFREEKHQSSRDQTSDINKDLIEDCQSKGIHKYPTQT